MKRSAAYAIGILSLAWLLWPRPAVAATYNITGSSDGTCNGAGSFTNVPITVTQGESVTVIVTITDPNYPPGWDVRGFPTGNVTIANNQSHSFSFTASASFSFSGWWPSSSCHKADGQVTVQVPPPAPDPTPAPAPTPTPAPAPTPTPTPITSSPSASTPVPASVTEAPAAAAVTTPTTGTADTSVPQTEVKANAKPAAPAAAKAGLDVRAIAGMSLIGGGIVIGVLAAIFWVRKPIP